MAKNVDQNVLIPLKLDAFIFNKAVFEAQEQNGSRSSGPTPETNTDPENKPVYAKMAPINQPNYTFLRLDKDYVQSDILNPIDLHNSWPAAFNSRFRDLGTNEDRVRRQGVYLHWTIPRMYRSGIAATEKKTEHVKNDRLARGLQVNEEEDGDDEPEKKKPDDIDATVPAFPNVPTRWLVIRHIHDTKAVVPATAKPPEFAAWVVESDRRWDLEKIEADVDLQVDVSPFIAATGGSEVDLSKQAEVFIGAKNPLKGWKEAEGTGTEEPDDRIQNFSLLNSSNQLFADYQPHCSNVFSIVDNFEYAEDKFLDKATVSYYVVGWHSKEQEDLFWGDRLDPPKDDDKDDDDDDDDDDDEKKKNRLTREKRLDILKLMIKLDQEEPDKEKRRDPKDIFDKWLEKSKKTHVVCHGAMYNVQWDRSKKPKTPADDASKHLNTALPIAVGTTPMDALLTFAHAHQDVDPVETAKLEALILRLETHLLARDDGVETQQQAHDLLYNWNYLRSDGGQVWNVAGKTADEAVGGGPGRKLLETLRQLNREQLLYDSTLRTLGRLRWELFSEWWLHITDKDRPENKDDAAKKDAMTKERVDDLGRRIYTLDQNRETLKLSIKDLSSPTNLKAGARPPFYQQRDPTLLVGGIKAGWPHDYLEKLQIRLDSQIVADTDDKKTPAWQEFIPLSESLPPPLIPTIRRLFNEFCALNPAKNSGVEPDLGDVQQMPLFHDNLAGVTARGPWRDRWESQPWFPLFLEWEVEYSHVPYEKWTLEDRRSRSSNVDQTRFGIPPKHVLAKTPEDLLDRQHIDGRALLLPQPSFSLEAKIRQLYDSTPSGVLEDIDKDKDKQKDFLNEEEWAHLKDNLHQLAFLSAPLSGFTAYLTTRLQGSHIKPNLKDPSTGGIKPINQAERIKAGFTTEQLQRISIETDDTPFGTDKKPSTTKFPLFKPVTHGQFRLTRLNIIDKFGQAIHAIDPTPTDKPQKVWPCIGEWYAPQVVGPEEDAKRRRPNVFDPEPDPTDPEDESKPRRCEFVQIPPQINQLSRLNVTFVKRDGGGEGAPFWRPADEWDNPIWGWVVINYANQGIQLFMPDGSFYREVRVAGPGNAQVGPEWLPFQPPKSTDPKAGPDASQLQLLCQRLGDPKFLAAFWKMIVEATNNMMPAPDAYASFSNALIGRPLALAHAGWSLELGADELGSKAAGDELKKERWQLLPIGKEKPKEPSAQAVRFQYIFPLKVGDKKRGFDGLVGYFPCRQKFGRNEDDVLDLGLNLETISSHYIPEKKKTEKDGEDGNSTAVTTGTGTDDEPPPPITKPAHLKATAFWADPERFTSGQDYAWARNDELDVYGLLLDPFSPVHTYSGILPVRELLLPAWTWQGAMARMKAFFHAGPLVVTRDVRAEMVPRHELREPVVLPEIGDEVRPVALPAVGSGDWAWVQPYAPVGRPEPGPGPEREGDDRMESFTPLPVTVEDERARFEAGPYTALEGYVMMVGRKGDSEPKT